MKLDKKTFLRILLLITFTVVLAVALTHLSAIGNGIKWVGNLLLPFFLGAAIALFFNVPMRFFEKRLFAKLAANAKEKHAKKIWLLKRIIAYLITLAIVIGIIVLIVLVIVPEIAETVSMLSTQIPLAMEEAENLMAKINKDAPYLETWLAGAGFDWNSLTEKTSGILGDLPSMVFKYGTSFISSVAGAIFNLIIAFAFSIYMLMQKESLKRHFGMAARALFPPKVANEGIRVVKLSYKTFANFLTGQCLEACILGVICFIGMSIFRLPLAIMASVIVGVCSLIPIFGAFIGCVIGMVLIAIVNPIQALIFLAMIIVIQQLEGNLIYPHVVGAAIGLPSIWVLLAVTVGAKMFGIVGMIVFIPLCSVIYTLFREFVYKRLKEKKSAVEVVRDATQFGGKDDSAEK